MRHPLVATSVVVLVVAVGWLWWWSAQEPRAPMGDVVIPVEPGDASPSADPTPTTPPVEEAVAATQLLAEVCAARVTPAAAGQLDDPDLDEASGLAAGRRNPDVLWVVEDSLNPPVLYAVGTDASVRARISVRALNFDWEDLAIAPGPDGGPWLYIADIGDNFAVRNRVSVLAFPEPALDDTVVNPTEIRLSYDGPPIDAEALVVAHTGIWVIAKVLDGGPAPLFHAPHGTTTLVRVGEFDTGGEPVTAADIDAAGRVLVLRTLQRVLLYTVDDADLVTAVGRAPCPLAIPDEPQGESVAITADGTRLFTVSEGAGATLHVVAVD